MLVLDSTSSTIRQCHLLAIHDRQGMGNSLLHRHHWSLCSSQMYATTSGLLESSYGLCYYSNRTGGTCCIHLLLLVRIKRRNKKNYAVLDITRYGVEQSAWSSMHLEWVPFISWILVVVWCEHTKRNKWHCTYNYNYALVYSCRYLCHSFKSHYPDGIQLKINLWTATLKEINIVTFNKYCWMTIHSASSCLLLHVASVNESILQVT